MFENLSVKKLVRLFLALILIIGTFQVIFFILFRSIYIHVFLSFLTLFLAIYLIGTVSSRLNR